MCRVSRWLRWKATAASASASASRSPYATESFRFILKGRHFKPPSKEANDENFECYCLYTRAPVRIPPIPLETVKTTAARIGEITEPARHALCTPMHIEIMLIDNILNTVAKYPFTVAYIKKIIA